MMVIGSTTLVQIGKERRWFPNAFLNKNFDFRVQVQHWGEWMLNYDSVIAPLKDLDPEWEPFFIRPPEDNKILTGTLMTHAELDKWREDTAAVYSDGYTSLTPDTEFMVSTPKAIWQEYRCFVVLGRYVTGSEYKRAGRAYQNAIVDDDIIEFVETRAQEWSPHLAFCIDIARTKTGLRIIEVNCINSSGFYKSDVSKTIQALEKMYV